MERALNIKYLKSKFFLKSFKTEFEIQVLKKMPKLQSTTEPQIQAKWKVDSDDSLEDSPQTRLPEEPRFNDQVNTPESPRMPRISAVRQKSRIERILTSTFTFNMLSTSVLIAFIAMLVGSISSWADSLPAVTGDFNGDIAFTHLQQITIERYILF